MTRRLIVSADDFGLHEAMNRGVIEGYEEGVVTSTSLVPCGAAFDDACAAARSRPGLDVGIHLTLVEERPLLGREALRTLAPEGRLPEGYAALFIGLAAGRIDAAEIELELDAQIRRALDAGVRVTHLDSHQHTHFFPGIGPILCRLALRHGIPAVRAGSRVVPGPTKFSLLLGPLARRFAAAARVQGLATPDTLWLPSPSGHVTPAILEEGLSRLPEGITEVVVHPGADQASLDRAYPTWRFNWPQELAAVRTPALRAALERHGVQLTRYSEIG